MIQHGSKSLKQRLFHSITSIIAGKFDINDCFPVFPVNDEDEAEDTPRRIESKSRRWRDIYRSIMTKLKYAFQFGILRCSAQIRAGLLLPEHKLLRHYNGSV